MNIFLYVKIDFSYGIRASSIFLRGSKNGSKIEKRAKNGPFWPELEKLDSYGKFDLKYELFGQNYTFLVLLEGVYVFNFEIPAVMPDRVPKTGISHLGKKVFC